MTAPVRVFPSPEALGDTLAQEILAGIEAARAQRRRYLLGCPGGRSGRPTYAALARRAAGRDLSGLVVVMMDEYLVAGADGTLQLAPPDAHYSCRRFAEVEIASALNTSAARPVWPEHVWLPDPADPAAYEARIAEAGGVDLFIVASGASDGHVAFNPPGTPADSGPWIVPLAETTRRDNLTTFPAFRTLDEVPSHGVSVGLGTIARQARHVRLVVTGAAKRLAAARVTEAPGFDPAWPATFIHGCQDPAIWLDAAAAPGGQDSNHPA